VLDASMKARGRSARYCYAIISTCIGIFSKRSGTGARSRSFLCRAAAASLNAHALSTANRAAPGWRPKAGSRGRIGHSGIGIRGQAGARTQYQTLAPVVGQTARVRGVGFFDFDHGQTGRSRSCIELHPVIAIDAVR